MKEIKLTNSERKVMVDDEDYDWLISLGNWSLHSSKEYAYNGSGLMHRVIYKKYYHKIKKQVDHIYGNGLNNQKYNLRDATPKINGFNHQGPNKQKTIPFRGVFWIKNRKRWNCLIYSEKKCVYSEYLIVVEMQQLLMIYLFQNFYPIL